jgi:replicative DNA helicase Mcm
MVNFQEQDIVAGWEEILSKDKYRLIIAEIAANYPDKKSVLVSYKDIEAYNIDFAMHVLENPDFCLTKGKGVMKLMMPPTWDSKNSMNLRISELPRDAKVDIRQLRSKHLGKLVAVEGLVRKATTVRPRMTYAKFRCARCNAEIWMEQSGMILKEPVMCSNTEGSCNKQAVRFILDDKESFYIDTQKIEIQESPEGLRGGAQPERLAGYVEDDISGLVTAGNRVTLNGIIRSVEKPDRDKTTVFEIYIEVMSVESELHEYDEIQITEEDEMQILEMSRDPKLFDNIIASISPTIFGMDEVKSAIALQLFGGCHKEMDDRTSIRGDIHILLVGDPGVAKSQILRYMSMLAPRGIYASGKSASAAGLTAAAVKDDFGDGRWTLEAGALVLADKGLACIDELDKMTAQDRSSLHEAMESQRISVAKAGITATLQCRCSMLAAANPKYGRFETEGGMGTLNEQIDLPPALMSRFDLLFVLTDKPDREKDTNLSKHILGVHRRGEVRQMSEDLVLTGIDVKKIREMTMSVKPFYDVEILRKYVAYSKRFIPVMTDGSITIIQKSYLRIRDMGKADGTITITARQLEALVRLSEASARLRLSRIVEESDAQRAVNLVEYYLASMASNNGGQWDMGAIDSGFTKKDRDRTKIVLGAIDMFGSPEGITLDEILVHTAEEGLNEGDVKKVLRALSDNGTIFSPRDSVYKKV